MSFSVNTNTNALAALETRHFSLVQKGRGHAGQSEKFGTL